MHEHDAVLEEAEQLLEDNVSIQGVEDAVIVGLTTWQLVGLYTSHSLSMWNSRSYEYASVLFTASAYPDTLTVASLRGLSANLAALLFSPAVGRWCNAHPSRLRTLQVSIVVQRVCICIACLGWALIVQKEGVDNQHWELKTVDDGVRLKGGTWKKAAILGVLLLLGMLEKLSAIGNLLVMERDWVPCLATSTTKPALHVLNAGIKRIDLICHLVAPLAISAVALKAGNLRWSALLIAGTQVLTVGPEMVTAHRVWTSSSSLQRPRKHPSTEKEPRRAGTKTSVLSLRGVCDWSDAVHAYYSSAAFLPSLSAAMQPFSVLTMGASMTVYLLAAQYPLFIITAARTLCTVVELSSTILTPAMVSWLNRRESYKKYTDADPMQSLVKVGLWGLGWQLTTLAPAVIALILLPAGITDPVKMQPVLSGILLTFLAASRLGPYAYSLVEQQLVQTIVPEEDRVTFSGVEMALVSFAELSRWGLTGIFGEPEQFKLVAIASFAVIAISTTLFWLWTRRWRLRKQDAEYELVAHNEPDL